jgi:hypothetical protein
MHADGFGLQDQKASRESGAASGEGGSIKDGDAKRQLIKIAEQYDRCGVNDHIPCRYLDLLAAADRLWE